MKSSSPYWLKICSILFSLIGAGMVIFGVVTSLSKHTLPPSIIVWLAIGGGIIVLGGITSTLTKFIRKW
jgi:hypothetical protein